MEKYAENLRLLKNSSSAIGFVSGGDNADDKDLRKFIQQCLEWDKRVSIYDISVQVRDGSVTISGVVDSYFKRQAVLDLLHAIKQVKLVNDEIKVCDYTLRTDGEIRRLIELSFKKLLLLSGEYLKVDVVEGIVKLEGVAYRPRIKGLASSFAWELSGVHDVINLIDLVVPEEDNRIKELNSLKDCYREVAI